MVALREARVCMLAFTCYTNQSSHTARTRLYLSGTRADDVAQLFSGSNIDAKVIGREIGRASALKQCYAAYTYVR